MSYTFSQIALIRAYLSKYLSKNRNFRPYQNLRFQKNLGLYV